MYFLDEKENFRYESEIQIKRYSRQLLVLE